MSKNIFKPHHINATPDDIEGNEGIGRYILLPGSEGRAREIAEHFDNLTINHHSRGHNLYLGTLEQDKNTFDVAVIATGIGCASMEITLHELYCLGAKRFLRIGTAGTLQPNIVTLGSLINVQASVRDEGTTRDYAPLELPAIASLEFVTSILVAAEKQNLTENLFTGIVHCKDSLYARELAAGPRAQENQTYLHLLSQSGVLATEMETAALFIQSQLYNYQLLQHGDEPKDRVLAGAILAVIGATNEWDAPLTTHSINRAIELGLEATKILAMQEILG